MLRFVRKYRGCILKWRRSRRARGMVRRMTLMRYVSFMLSRIPNEQLSMPLGVASKGQIKERKAKVQGKRAWVDDSCYRLSFIT